VSYTGPLRPTAKPRKPSPTNRWTVRIDSPFRGSLDYDGEQVGYLRMSNVDNAHVVAQLNRNRVTLRAPKAGKRDVK
jgi:hypothetical protein